MGMLIGLLLLAAPAIEVESHTPPRYEVVAFMATNCPMAKLSAGRLNILAEKYPQVHFQGVSANHQDSDAEVAAFACTLRFDFRKDPDRIVGLGATRSPEVFLLVDGKVVYQGRIDDQYTPGTNRSQPTRCDLEEGIQEVLAGKPVSVPKTMATGCQITLPTPLTLPTLITSPTPSSGEVTFVDIAPVLHGKCAACHRPGEVAPFSLLTYNDTIGWAEMIREVVSNNRMPPWHANPRHGKFSNDRSLTPAEKALLLRWIDAGSPAGNHEPGIPEFEDGWTIKPDLVLQMESPFQVPAEGIVEWQEFVLDPRLTKDTWVQAIQIRPGNRAVVHHINVFLRPKGADPRTHYTNMQDGWMAAIAPGTAPTSWPTGIAKVIPAGFQVVLSIHYQPNGTPQTDRTSIAFQFAEPSTVRQQVATRVHEKRDLVIEPNSAPTLVYEWVLEEDYTLHALYPHMHVRGRSMRIAANDSILLDVPQYDFNWQHRYVLAEPKQLAAGTVIRCVAVFDNTASNPNNPDPNAVVRHGPQSADEMFQACFEITRTHEDRQLRAFTVWPALAVALCAASVLFCCHRRTRRCA
jgi:hypothetical protein